MVFTDSLGMFEIMTAASGDVLVFRANGFERNRRKLAASENEITVDMILMPGEQYEKLAVDHGHLHEKDLASIHKHHRIIYNDFSIYHDMRQLLQSSLLGTRVTDQGSIRVYVRGRDVGSGGSSMNDGAATFVLDGVIVRDVDLLSPQDVRSVRLLTGHEASRLFGSHGANGVVWIRTR